MKAIRIGHSNVVVRGLVSKGVDGVIRHLSDCHMNTLPIHALHAKEVVLNLLAGKRGLCSKSDLSTGVIVYQFGNRDAGAFPETGNFIVHFRLMHRLHRILCSPTSVSLTAYFAYASLFSSHHHQHASAFAVDRNSCRKRNEKL
jgi:hypothetical protein